MPPLHFWWRTDSLGIVYQKPRRKGAPTLGRASAFGALRWACSHGQFAAVIMLWSQCLDAKSFLSRLHGVENLTLFIVCPLHGHIGLSSGSLETPMQLNGGGWRDISSNRQCTRYLYAFTGRRRRTWAYLSRSVRLTHGALPLRRVRGASSPCGC